MYRELLELPNLVSLSRIFLAPVIGYLVWRDTSEATVVAVLIYIIAGITDGLDGYLARKMNRVTPVGVWLDPVADKLFAAILVVALILWRDFPLWLAGAIVGRDVLILGLGTLLIRSRDLSLPSNLTGKWTFAAMAVLLGAYVIRFEFSIALMTPIVVILLIASLVSYGRVFVRARRALVVQPFDDRSVFKISRYMILAAAAVAHAIMFYREFMG